MLKIILHNLVYLVNDPDLMDKSIDRREALKLFLKSWKIPVPEASVSISAKFFNLFYTSD